MARIHASDDAWIMSKPKTVAITPLDAACFPLNRALSDCRDAADCSRGRGGIRFDRLSGWLGDGLDAVGDGGGAARPTDEDPAAARPCLLRGHRDPFGRG